MKDEEKVENAKEYKSYLVIRKAIILTIAVCGVMLLLFFVIFHGELSREINDWGSFGCYFSSVTGLLAFLGVLYTAGQAEKRADESREYFRKQLCHAAHRDWFNKFLDTIEELSSLHSKVWILYKIKYKNKTASTKASAGIPQFDEIKILIRAKLRIVDVLLDRTIPLKEDHKELADLIKEYFTSIDGIDSTKPGAEEKVFLAIIKRLGEIVEKTTVMAIKSKKNVYLEE
ncbi:hypothetical protein [uncultured Bacteroides sp.]|uniref:hypothetical protein n=1 Tax=uncultured Bacteroides sp. TaxID=162156 RepID=UPI002AABDB03|nr:hypothetical protein [uncultured Bacteroides sp.]